MYSYLPKCSFFILGLLLTLQEYRAELKTTNNDYSPNTKRFKDVLAEAKRAAIDEYLDNVLGGQKRSNERKRGDALTNILREDIEKLMYARKLQTLFRKRCTEWWCFGDKATSTTGATTTTTSPENTESGDETTVTSTTTSTSTTTTTIPTTTPTTTTTSTTVTTPTSITTTTTTPTTSTTTPTTSTTTPTTSTTTPTTTTTFIPSTVTSPTSTTSTPQATTEPSTQTSSTTISTTTTGDETNRQDGTPWSFWYRLPHRLRLRLWLNWLRRFRLLHRNGGRFRG